MFKTKNPLRINGRVFFVLLIFFSVISTYFYWKYLSKKDLDRFSLNSKIPNNELALKSNEAISIWLSEQNRSLDIKNRPQILILEDELMNKEEIERLFSKRNNRPVNIKE